MKIAITYKDGEPIEDVLHAVKPLFRGDVKRKISYKYAPYIHVYLSGVAADKVPETLASNREL